MSVNVAKFDIETMGAFQQEMHMVASGDDIWSTFQHDFHPMTFYTRIPEKLKPSSNGDDITYVANPTYDYLTSVTMHQKFPAIRVKDAFKDKFRICWPHNLGHNVVKHATLKMDDETLYSFDTTWLDIHSQYFCKPGFRDNINQCVGNVKFLEEWTDFLPEYTTTVHQPFYYSRDMAWAIPLHLCTESKVAHVYSLRRKISEILRMQAYRDGKWVTCMCEMSCLEGLNSEGMLPLPELWGDYAKIDPAEKELRRCKTEHEFFIEDVVACDSSNDATYPSKVEVNLDAKTPCKGIFWVAENQKAARFNNHSNYTTDSTDVYLGWNPCELTGLKYGGTDRLKELTSVHTERVIPYHNLPSAPVEAGYNAFTFCGNIMSLDAEPGIVFDGLKARLIVKLGDTNPFLKKIGSVYRELADKTPALDDLVFDDTKVDVKPVDSRSPSFVVKVRCLITRKITFVFDPVKKCYFPEMDLAKKSPNDGTEIVTV